jgi:hypothetical protein
MGVTASCPVLGALAGRVLFAVGGCEYRVGDVVLVAHAEGAWAAASAMAVTDPGAAVGGRELAEAEVSFRRARRLVAADELKGWLQEWGVSASEWRDFLRRELLRRRDPVQARPISAADRTVLVDVICSGELVRWAERLAEKLAVRRAHGDEPPTLPDDLPELDDAFREFVSRTGDDRRALERELASSFLDWTHFLCEWVSDSREDVLREIASCVRVDGRDLSDVAAQAGVPLGRTVLWLEECERDVREALLAARSGDLLDGVSLDGRQSVIVVRQRTSPALDDAEVYVRARERAVEGARRRVVDEWVVFRAGD